MIFARGSIGCVYATGVLCKNEEEEEEEKVCFMGCS